MAEPIPTRPEALPVLDASIPAELKALRQWVLWRYDRTKDGWSKVPYMVEAECRASSTDPKTWSGFADAVARYKSDAAGGWAGVGFVFAADGPHCGVDLDAYRDPGTGRVSDHAAEVIRSLGSYAEVSPSSTGVKLVLRGKRPGGKAVFKVGSPQLKQAEVFSRGRYFALTGHRLEGSPAEVIDRQEALVAWYSRGFALPTDGPEPPDRQGRLDELERRPPGGGSLSPEERAGRYVEACPGAVSGEGGHTTTLRVARAVVYGFDLGPERGFDLLWRDYNPKCQPAWTEAELRHKCQDADRPGFPRPRGWLLVAERPRRGAPAGVTTRGGDGASAGPDRGGVNEADDDPHRLARLFLDDHLIDGQLALRWWREEWQRWRDGAYAPVLDKEVRAELSVRVKREFDALNLLAIADWEENGCRNPAGEPCPRPVAKKVSARLVADVAAALAGLARVRGDVCQPSWLDGAAGPPAGELLVCSNGVLHLPAWAEGSPCLTPLTPRLFTPTTVPCAFDPACPDPTGWLRFLESVWGDDSESIATLQEWFGYLLLPDTSQEKICMLVGPKRSGKGTIARVLKQLVGPGNYVAPTLAGLSMNFGLQSLLGKTVAGVSDARLSGRTDTAVVVERLLSISGEDDQTVERKHLTAVTGRLPVRFTILTNELPRLNDASGALVGRLVVLRMTRSFYGVEDTGLTDRLVGELPGILLWAMRGWARLRVSGHFVQPQSGLQLVRQMENLASPVGQFVRECCEVGAGFRVPIPDLYQRWRAWCEEKGREPTSETVFGRDLRAAVPGVDDSQPRIDGVRVRVYEGIRLQRVAGELRGHTPF